MANIKVAGYENIYVDCDQCKSENVYNRVSDGIGDDVDNEKNITCNKCGKLFNISSDEIVSAKYRWFFNDLGKLKENKEYRMYILNLCQGCECFFRQAILNKLIDRNSAFRDKEGRVQLDKIKPKEYTFNNDVFAKLRKEFLNLYELERNNDNGNLSKMKQDRRKECFNNIQGTNLDKMRNMVVHSGAYRPSLKNVLSHEKLAKDVIWLGQYLEIEDSVYLLNDRVG